MDAQDLAEIWRPIIASVVLAILVVAASVAERVWGE